MPERYSIQEVADKLGFKRQNVYYHIDKGNYPKPKYDKHGAFYDEKKLKKVFDIVKGV